MHDLVKEYLRVKSDIPYHKAALVVSIGVVAAFSIAQWWIAALFALFAHRHVYNVYCGAKQFLIAAETEFLRQEKIQSLGGKK